MNVTVNATLHGPVLAGRGPAAVKEMLRDIEDTLGQQGYAEVMTNLNVAIRHPTPYYETQVAVQRTHPNIVVVHDRRIVYGPWLEGISNRNRTTRFKGYRSFARGTVTLLAKARALVEPVVARHLARLR